MERNYGIEFNHYEPLQQHLYQNRQRNYGIEFNLYEPLQQHLHRQSEFWGGDIPGQ